MIVDQYSATYRNGSSKIARYLRVIEDGNTLRLAGATDVENGITSRTVFPNKLAAVQFLHSQGGQNSAWPMIAAGAINKGATVYRAANGQVSASGSSSIGIAKTTVSSAGTIVEVYFRDGSADAGSVENEVVYKADGAEASANRVNVYSAVANFGSLPAVSTGASVTLVSSSEKLANYYVANEAGDAWIAVEGDAAVDYRDTVATLLSNPTAAKVVILLGRNDVGDGGGQAVYYDADSTATIDGVFTFPGVGGTLSFSGTTFDGTAGTGRYISVDKSAERIVAKAGGSQALADAALTPATAEDVTDPANWNLTADRNEGAEAPKSVPISFSELGKATTPTQYRTSQYLSATPSEAEWDAFITAAGSNQVIVDSNITVDFAKTVTVPLRFEGTGGITKSGSGEWILSEFTAGRKQIFFGTFLTAFTAFQFGNSPRPSDAHTLSFSGQTDIFPEWWGAVYAADANCADAMDSMQRALIRSRGDHNQVHWKISFPANSYVRSTNNRWHQGLWSAEIDYANATVENPASASTTVFAGIFTRVSGDLVNEANNTTTTDNQKLPANDYKINAVPAGDTVVTLQAATLAGDFIPGQYILLAGFSSQAQGYPINPQVFEYVQLESVDGANLTLSSPCKYSYSDSWFDSSDTNFAGYPRAFPIPGFGKFLRISNIKEVAGELKTTEANLKQERSVRLNGYLDIVAERCNFQYLVPQIADTVTFLNCTSPECEADKIVSLLRIEGGKFGDIGQGSGIQTMVLDGATVDTVSSWSCRHTSLKNNASVRLVEFRKGGLTAQNSNIKQITTEQQISQLSAVSLGYVMSDSLIQMTPDQYDAFGGTSGVNLEPGDMLMWIDGTNLFNNNTGTGKITSVTHDAGVVSIKYILDGTRSGATSCRLVPISDISIMNSNVGVQSDRCWANSISYPENGFSVDGQYQVYSVNVASNSLSNFNALWFPGGIIHKIEFDIWQTYTGTGTPVTFTADDATDVISAAGHPYSNGDTVWVSSDGTLPAGLSPETTYYVRDSTSGTLKLATTSGGAAIDITDSGTGTHSIAEVPESPGFTYHYRNGADTNYFVDGRVAGRRWIQRNADDSGNDSKLLGTDNLGIKTARRQVVRWYSTNGTSSTSNLPAHTEDEAVRGTFLVWVKTTGTRFRGISTLR